MPESAGTRAPLLTTADNHLALAAVSSLERACAGTVLDASDAADGNGDATVLGVAATALVVVPLAPAAAVETVVGGGVCPRGAPAALTTASTCLPG